MTRLFESTARERGSRATCPCRCRHESSRAGRSRSPSGDRRCHGELAGTHLSVWQLFDDAARVPLSRPRRARHQPQTVVGGRCAKKRPLPAQHAPRPSRHRCRQGPPRPHLRATPRRRKRHEQRLVAALRPAPGGVGRRALQAVALRGNGGIRRGGEVHRFCSRSITTSPSVDS